MWWMARTEAVRRFDRLQASIERLGKLMALNAEDLKARIDLATTNIGGDLRRVKDDLAAALAGQEAASDQAVQQALGGFDELAARLENLAAETPEDELEQEEGEGGPESQPVP